MAVWESTCAICNQEIHHMARFHAAHRNKDAIVLGVSIDGYARKAQVLGFVREHRLDFTNLVGELPQMRKFGAGPVMGTPTYYIFSPKGKLRARQAGPVTQTQVEEYLARTAVD